MDGLITRSAATRLEQRSYAALLASARNRLAQLVNLAIVWLLSRLFKAVGIVLSELFVVGDEVNHRVRGLTSKSSVLLCMERIFSSVDVTELATNICFTILSIPRFPIINTTHLLRSSCLGEFFCDVYKE